ncbi:MAG: COX15/CtaA family protein [Pseudomonadota bacterium]
MSDLSMSAHNKTIAYWLFGVAAMVLTMAVIGAITRLTGSGLSMVEWQPVSGILPPLSEQQWLEEFNLYRQSPEYQKINAGMALEDFKFIFFWEWFHRIWGRMIGAALAIPLLIFALKKIIPQGYTLKIFGVGLLVGCQALMGWYMVQSGLVERPSVSHYRLAAHLSLAFVIFGALLWLAFDLLELNKKEAVFCVRRHGWTSLGFLSITVVWGAFVAGLDAGLLYNSFPLMNGDVFPSGSPDILNDHGWVQFAHRWIAMFTGLFVFAFALRIQSWALAGMVITQVGLGIATLLSQVWIPLATLHQAGAFILVGILLFELFRLKRVNQ